MEQLENIKTIVEIIGSIAAGCVIVFNTYTKWNQTSISLTLLSYEEKQKHRYLSNLFVFLNLSLLIFMLGEVSYSIGQSIREKYKDQLSEETGDFVTTIATDKIGFIMIGILLLLIVVTVILTIIRWKKDKKDLLLKGCISFSRYLELWGLLFISILFFVLDVLGCFASEDNPILTDIFLSLFVGGTLTAYLSQIFNKLLDDIATIKYFDAKTNRYIYLFCMKDNHFIAGDSIYMKDCNEFYFLDNLDNKTLVRALKSDLIFVHKNNLSDERDNKAGQRDILNAIININYDDIVNKNEVIKKITIISRDKNNNLVYKIDSEKLQGSLNSKMLVNYDLYFID